MNRRKTEVAWSNKLFRVEYLDDAGTPYFCCFEPRDDSSQGVTTAGRDRILEPAAIPGALIAERSLTGPTLAELMVFAFWALPASGGVWLVTQA